MRALQAPRVEGDVTITKNNAKIVFSEIMGDLIIEGNNATLAESIVHGEVRIAGNNAVLVQNELAELGVPYDAVPVAGPVRVNLTITDPDGTRYGSGTLSWMKGGTELPRRSWR